MTIFDRTDEIIETFEKYNMNQDDLSKIEKMIDEYLKLCNDNIILYEIFLDPQLIKMYSDGAISSSFFISYLRIVINFGNRLNLSDEDFYKDFTMANQLITSCACTMDKYGDFGTYIVSDSPLFDNMYWLFTICCENNNMPIFFKYIIAIIMYKNIISYGYGTEPENVFFDKMIDFYTDILDDPYINDYIELNDLNSNRGTDSYKLYSFLKDYIDKKTKCRKGVLLYDKYDTQNAFIK